MQIGQVLVHLDLDNVPEHLIAKLRIFVSAGIAVELFECCYCTSLHHSYLFDKKAEQHAIDSYLNQRKALIATLADQLGGQGAEVTYSLRWSDQLADSIFKQAQQCDADLIIASKHSHQFGEYLLNKGDWRLISHTSVPLLLVGNETWSMHPRIAAAVEPFLECDAPEKLDNEVLAASKSMVDLLIGELHIMHCFHVLPQSAVFDEHLTIDYEALRSKVRQQHTDALQQLITHQGVRAAIVHLEEGEVHTKLPEIVMQAKIDMVVMGAVNHDFFDRLLTGSAIDKVMDNIAADLLVVPEPE